jgi:hypothetical protein
MPGERGHKIMTEETVDTDSAAYRSGSVIPAVVDGGEWSASFGLSWTEMMVYDQARNGRILGVTGSGQFIRKQAGAMGLASARSEIAAYFLQQDAEWLFMVDSDMGYAPETLDRMIASAEANDVPVLGALCFAQKIDPDQNQGPLGAVRYRIIPTIYGYVTVETTGESGFRHVKKYQRDTFQHVAGTGAACLLVHRRALEAVGPEPFMPITDPTAGGHGTSRTFSEDLSFCIRVQGAGMMLGVDTSIKTSHYKGGIYLDEVEYAKQQETLIQAKGHEIARNAELYMRNNLSPLGLVIP